ncbi:hypothetical protein MARPO_0010s0034 [Marchantia polymorpha]|uniref:Uncharacterized protein n=1 Tax=Marchantia polymorpha TaxID=3197 RepID=A0A2R6XKJ4_MARPO|nr:hypothetical protein MARPO_0010s0034 [Marchantia polymorpha]|eukprot:PTQ46623.1 hypothetical protein MARPO_0010s0034 [Marchantia polymorpha]
MPRVFGASAARNSLALCFLGLGPAFWSVAFSSSAPVRAFRSWEVILPCCSDLPSLQPFSISRVVPVLDSISGDDRMGNSCLGTREYSGDLRLWKVGASFGASFHLRRRLGLRNTSVWSMPWDL